MTNNRRTKIGITALAVAVICCVSALTAMASVFSRSYVVEISEASSTLPEDGRKVYTVEMKEAAADVSGDEQALEGVTCKDINGKTYYVKLLAAETTEKGQPAYFLDREKEVVYVSVNGMELKEEGDTGKYTVTIDGKDSQTTISNIVLTPAK